MRWIYSLLFYLFLPFIVLRIFWKSIAEPAYRDRLTERFGWYPERSSSTGVIWVHAVSVGEAEAAFPLIEEIRKRYPNTPLLVTCTTPTGSRRIKAVLGDSVSHVYLPFDLPCGINRFFKQYNPILAVILETEIWPNLYHACGTRQIPLALVNARLSAKSAKGYGKLKGLVQNTLSQVRLIAAQSASDADRFKQIGASPDIVKVTGNVKYDIELPDNYFLLAEQLKKRFFDNKLVWIAASTHEGEESQLLRVFSDVKKIHTNLVLVLAPRHPSRFERVFDLCLASGFRLVRRSIETERSEFDVFLLDTLGELRLFYGASDIAFVGGSLVETGGHNVLEAAIASIPVLIGPHTYNFSEISDRLLHAGGAIRVQNSIELKQQLLKLSQDSNLRQTIGKAARTFVETGRGAVKQISDELYLLIR